MAALRSGIHTVVIPRDNEKDLEEIDQNVRAGLRFVAVDHVDQVRDFVLLKQEAAHQSASACRALEGKQVDHAVTAWKQ